MKKNHFEVYAIQAPAEIFKIPSRKMIKTLWDCVELEANFPGRTYGPADIGGSFSGLYTRGFMDIKVEYDKKSKPASWYVTTKGLHFLLSIATKTHDL